MSRGFARNNLRHTTRRMLWPWWVCVERHAYVNGSWIPHKDPSGSTAQFRNVKRMYHALRTVPVGVAVRVFRFQHNTPSKQWRWTQSEHGQK